MSDYTGPEIKAQGAVEAARSIMDAALGPSPRPITRADEAAVRVLAAGALGVEASDITCFDFHEHGQLRAIGVCGYYVGKEQVAALARAGIRPGPEGWTWEGAPAPAEDEPEIQHTIVCDNAGGENCDCADVITVGDHFRSRTTGDVRRAAERLNSLTRYPGAPSLGEGWRMVNTEGQTVGWETAADLLDGAKWERCAAPPPIVAVAEIRHTLACKSAGLPHGEGCECQGFAVGQPAASPAWLLAAVETALPPSGEPRPLDVILSTVRHIPGAPVVTWHEVEAALAALTKGGTIEAGPSDSAWQATWRRWGVPSGYRWMEHGHDRYGLDGPMPECRTVARAGTTGAFVLVAPDGTESLDKASPPTLEGAKRDALRACWEHGVFGVGAPAALTPDQAERLRSRLLALLAKEPRREMDLLLDALATLAPVKVNAPELRAVLVSIGAVCNPAGCVWSIPDPPAPTVQPGDVFRRKRHPSDGPYTVGPGSCDIRGEAGWALMAEGRGGAACYRTTAELTDPAGEWERVNVGTRPAPPTDPQSPIVWLADFLAGVHLYSPDVNADAAKAVSAQIQTRLRAWGESIEGRALAAAQETFANSDPERLTLLEETTDAAVSDARMWSARCAEVERDQARAAPLGAGRENDRHAEDDDTLRIEIEARASAGKELAALRTIIAHLEADAALDREAVDLARAARAEAERAAAAATARAIHAETALNTLREGVERVRAAVGAVAG